MRTGFSADTDAGARLPLGLQAAARDDERAQRRETLSIDSTARSSRIHLRFSITTAGLSLLEGRGEPRKNKTMRLGLNNNKLLVQWFQRQLH